ncbi:MAG: hypothetical protein MK108_16950 [Mariniblastus sp.]|nr:hypothetical protein [Mariniblastus sp.]
MRIPFCIRALGCLSLLACWATQVVAQTDDPLAQDSQRVTEMNRMVREFIAQAQELEQQGDKAGAILMKNKALGLIKSLRTMNKNQANPKSETPGQAPPEPPAVTRAEAVVTLNNSITLLNLLNQKELGRRINNIMQGIATQEEIEEILAYDRQQGKGRPGNAAKSEPSSDESPGPDSPEPATQRSTEQVQNQLTALKTAMDSLLDAGQTDQAKLLAQSIMLRRAALREQQTTWQYDDDYSADQEVEILRLARKLLFENGNMMQSKVIDKLANQVAQDSRAVKTGQQTAPPPTADAENQNQLITRLVQKVEESEEQRVKLQSELRTLQRLNESLNKQIEQLKAKDKQTQDKQ